MMTMDVSRCSLTAKFRAFKRLLRSNAIASLICKLIELFALMCRKPRTLKKKILSSAANKRAQIAKFTKWIFIRVENALKKTSKNAEVNLISFKLPKHFHIYYLNISENELNISSSLIFVSLPISFFFLSYSHSSVLIMNATWIYQIIIKGWVSLHQQP